MYEVKYWLNHWTTHSSLSTRSIEQAIKNAQEFFNDNPQLRPIIVTYPADKWVYRIDKDGTITDYRQRPTEYEAYKLLQLCADALLDMEFTNVATSNVHLAIAALRDAGILEIEQVKENENV